MMWLWKNTIHGYAWRVSGFLGYAVLVLVLGPVAFGDAAEETVLDCASMPLYD